MRPDQIEAAARLLAAARSGQPIPGFPTKCRPESDADAYQIQDAVARQLGETIGGWKVGAASPATAAYCAPIYAQMIRPSPAAYAVDELRLIGIEGEIAFRLGCDLPPRSQAYDAAEVSAGAAVHPAIEVVDSRFVDLRALDRPSLLADNQGNGGLVYGAPVSDWLGLDFAAVQITITEDGKPVASSAETAHDPVAALVDFANLMRSRGGVKAGTFVTTGARTRMVFTRHGTKISADFGTLGRVDIAFAI
jgi:2-keto-4-pentenoate hydratase